MNYCHICGSTGAIKCERCPNSICTRHAVQIVGPDGGAEVVCGKCGRLAAEGYKESPNAG